VDGDRVRSHIGGSEVGAETGATDTGAGTGTGTGEGTSTGPGTGDAVFTEPGTGVLPPSTGCFVMEAFQYGNMSCSIVLN
jgi:hypothetical protein